MSVDVDVMMTGHSESVDRACTDALALRGFRTKAVQGAVVRLRATAPIRGGGVAL
jgi:hypothetical protein